MAPPHPKSKWIQPHRLMGPCVTLTPLLEPSWLLSGLHEATGGGFVSSTSVDFIQGRVLHSHHLQELNTVV